jgi:hypothetical protein
MPLPNWPVADPVIQPCSPIVNQNPTKDPNIVVSIPLHSTIQAAVAAGAVEGTILSAPLAPSTGPINAPAESMVVVTVKNFFETPTWRAIRTALQGAGLVMFLVFGNALLNVWTANKSIFDKGAIDWRATERAAEITSGPVLVLGLMALMKKKDNNPSK